VPLYKVDDQEYLYYNKGAIVLFAIEIRLIAGGQCETVLSG
jgi:hypothetical protein